MHKSTANSNISANYFVFTKVSATRIHSKNKIAKMTFTSSLCQLIMIAKFFCHTKAQMVSLLKDNCMLFPPCLWPKKDIVKIFVGSFFGAYYTKLEDNGLDKKVHLSFIYFYQNILFCKQYQLYMPTQLNLCRIIMSYIWITCKILKLNTGLYFIKTLFSFLMFSE